MHKFWRRDFELTQEMGIEFLRCDPLYYKTHLDPEARAHVTTRNFPDSVADFRRRTGIREGGEVYLFATTDLRGRPLVLVCQKLTPPVQAVE